MKELQEIVKAFDRARQDGKKAALATVVLVEGSAYRRAGARMLITEDGQLTGAISGGCLEGDALRKARLVIMQQEPMLVTYDTMDDDDAKLGVGLGCNGIIHILIEPVNETGHNPVSLLKSIINGRRDAVLVTLFAINDRRSLQPGTCLHLDCDKTVVENGISKMAYRDTLVDDAGKALEEHHSATRTYNTDGVEYTAFIEYLKPVISLVIIGAGNDAIPLTRIAAILGWRITVVDGRPNYASPQRFPLADVVTARPTQVLSHLEINGQTAFVLMTHNYTYELELLKELLPLPLPYIGILGPKKKLQRLLGELAEGGLKVTNKQLERIYGPVGLDIGSEGAEEIALSIIAEIKAVFSARNGRSLKHKPIPIHTIALNPVIS